VGETSYAWLYESPMAASIAGKGGEMGFAPGVADEVAPVAVDEIAPVAVGGVD
jgi:hypothetical protein